jgi:LAO/AO transport system kinase
MDRGASVDVERILAGDRRAVARAISLVETEGPEADRLLRSLFGRTGNAYRIGITGPPGAGKSTITSKLASAFRRSGHQVGIIAVDPTSPFTGGALLGDRVRMTDVELDDGVFIRSMASRGSLGGLSRKAGEAADVLDAAGKQTILLETVGVGQSELDIAGAADTTVVVLVPESGDSIQAMKAGLMEIADVFVVNKSDREGADQAVMAIQMILHFRERAVWMPEVVRTVASEGRGIDDLSQALERHRRSLESKGGLAERRRNRLKRHISDLVAERLKKEFWSEERDSLLGQRLEDLLRRDANPYDIVEELLGHFHERGAP